MHRMVRHALHLFNQPALHAVRRADVMHVPAFFQKMRDQRQVRRHMPRRAAARENNSLHFSASETCWSYYMPEKADESSQGERTLPFEKGRHGTQSSHAPYRSPARFVPRLRLAESATGRARLRRSCPPTTLPRPPPEERDGRGGLPKNAAAPSSAPSGRRMAQKSGFLLEGGVGETSSFS